MSLRNKIKKYNPFKNKTQIGDTEFKWKVKPKGLNTSLKVEVSTEIGNVKFYAEIEGQIYQISQDGIGLNLRKDANESFRAEFGVIKKF